MPKTTIVIHPDALRDLETAQEWYADRSIIAAHAFIRELTHAITQVRENPTMWPIFTGATRRYVFPRFPFSLVYRVRLATLVEVIAVMHQKKHPGYWCGRL